MKKKEKSKSNSNSNSNSQSKGVEELLQAAADEMLLDLSVNSHISHVSPNYIPSDLDRRFQALKSQPSSNSNSLPQSQPQHQHDSSAAAHGDDLSARFAALKASLSSSTSDETSSKGSDNEDDEVEKLIRWAKDAARLDPSPPSDDDYDQDGH